MADHIVFFDGVCNLCNRSVQFLIQADKKRKLRYSSLQSEFARNFLGEQYPKDEVFSSFILYDRGKLFFESTAALRLCLRVGYPLKLLYPLILIPAVVRNSVYSLVSRRRYKWFGKRTSCMIPDASLKDLFLE